MDYNKGQEESVKDYFIRICKDKEILQLTWDEIAILMNKETGKSFKESSYRKKWSNYKEGLEDGFKKATDSDATLKEHELSILKIQEEKVKLRDNRVELNRQIRAKARFENITEELKKAMEETLEPLPFIKKSKQSESENIIVASFSDFHVGSSFKNHFGEYSIEIFRNRFSEYIDRLINLREKENAQIIKILALGDMISGLIHVSTRLQNAEDVIRQTQISAEYISQGLQKLSEHFSIVEYYTALGNHGRVTPTKEETLYNENFEKIIPWYIKARTENIKNIFVLENEIDEGIITANVFDNLIFGVHGDKDSFHRAAINLPVMLRKFPISIWCGHLHSFAVESQHGIEVIRSGSLCGTDEYAKNARFTGRPSQAVGVYNKKGLVSIYNMVFE